MFRTFALIALATFTSACAAPSGFGYDYAEGAFPESRGTVTLYTEADEIWLWTQAMPNNKPEVVRLEDGNVLTIFDAPDNGQLAVMANDQVEVFIDVPDTKLFDEVAEDGWREIRWCGLGQSCPTWP